ncbi:MAG: HNH endonuclease signature motif containing protein [Stagnimonas sp.]|nr:HNH endonuclease signature motif containing protein [Stagnimonas sp.]
MKGTQHFSRLGYNVRRGLREIVAPSHKIPKTAWLEVLNEFSQACAYCGAAASAENRGIVPDHLVAVTDYGELVAGNTIPACQTCNDSRGNKDWREFIRNRYPMDAAVRIKKIEDHVQRHNYVACTPETALAPQELSEYNEILVQWEQLLKRAQALQVSVAKRRKMADNQALKPTSPPSAGPRLS